MDGWIGSLLEAPCSQDAGDGDKAAVIDTLMGFSAGTACDIRAHGAADRELLPPGTRLHIAAIGHRTVSDTIQAAQRLRAEGFEPVPDIVARRFTRQAHLGDYLSRLRGEAGVGEVLILGGGGRNGSEPKVSALDIVRTGLFERHGIRRIGVAAHPTRRNAFLSTMVYSDVTELNAWARDSGSDIRFVTQPCVDADAILAWEEATRVISNRLPIDVGLIGPMAPGPLSSLEMMCGMGDGMGDGDGAASGTLARVALSAPSRMVATIARYRRENPGCLLRHAHLVAADGLRGTALWLDAVLRGAFSMHEDGGSFTVRYHTAD